MPLPPADPSDPAVRPEPRPKRPGVDADALLRSLAPVVAKPEAAPEPPRRKKPRPEPSPEPALDPVPEPHDARRAKLDVAINPGEGTTAIYVRVPRTTHVSLKLLALQNQAAMDGPTELASIVRTAIDEYLARQRAAKAAA